MTKSSSKGFTLVEVMVVLIIITLMGAIVAPAIFNRLDQAREKKVEADLRVIESALKLYRLDNFSWPNQTQGLEALVRDPSSARSWRGPYLDALPLDPWENPYQYQIPSVRGGGDYDLFSFGADGVQGGEGQAADLGNWDLR